MKPSFDAIATREAVFALLQEMALAALVAARNLSSAAEAAMLHGISLDEVNDEIADIRARMVGSGPDVTVTPLAPLSLPPPPRRPPARPAAPSQ